MERINLQQSEFSVWELRREGFWDSLCEQRAALGELERVMEESDPIVTSAVVADLDLDLLAYACSELYRQLVAATKTDGATLLAMTVTANDSDTIQKKWENWLEGGEVWQQLMQSHWRHIKDRAIKQVCTSIQKGGAELDKKIVREIEQAVVGLKLDDVLAPEVYARFYPETEEEVSMPIDVF